LNDLSKGNKGKDFRACGQRLIAALEITIRIAVIYAIKYENKNMKEITLSNFKNDKYYPRVAQAFNELLEDKKYVAAVDVYLKIGMVDKKKLEDWRFGRIPYLERVITGNLSQTQRVLRIIRNISREMKLKPSITVYKIYGKGQKVLLRFSKTGVHYLEEMYSTHYINPKIAEKEISELPYNGMKNEN
jgi:hypothetical protein